MFTFTVEEKIKKTKIILQKENPFFSYILFYAKFKEDNNIPTMCIDKRLNIYYNRQFLENHKENIDYLLMHETLHAVLKHHDRLKQLNEKNYNTANIAMNAVIDYMLENIKDNMKMNIVRPDFGTIFHKDYFIGFMNGNGTTQHFQQPIYMGNNESNWEYVYYKLLEQEDGYSSEGSDSNYEMDRDIETSGENSDQEKNNGESNENITGKSVDDLVSEAATYAKMQGNLPAGMERFVDSLFSTKTTWTKILKENLQGKIPSGFTFKRPNRRCHGLKNTFLPSRNIQNKLKVYAAIDTSGSISQDELTYFLSELYSILESFRMSEMTVMTCDMELHDIIEIKNKEELKDIKPKGGGGTSFQPVFNKIQEFKPTDRDILIYLTDGMGDFPCDKPKYRVIWLNTSDKKHNNYPFGEVIDAEIDKR